jgi:3-oxoacyl-[acyl-carrier-protein] synthase II
MKKPSSQVRWRQRRSLRSNAVMDVVVTGMAGRSALGNLDQTWQALLQGRSGIRISQPWPEQPALPLGLLAETPALDLRSPVQLVVAEALADAQLTPPLRDCGVVIGSSRGNQTLLEQQLWAEPPWGADHPAADWWAALPHIAAVTAAQIVQTQAIVLSPMAACATGIGAIARGAELIREGLCDRVLVGAVDTPVTRLTIAGFRQMGALATTGCYPFDRRREGLVLGEGGAVLVLESADLARSRSVRIYGRILGYGLSADAYHVSSPDPMGNGAKQAIWQGLKQANLAPDAIGYIHAHGTSTQLNDASEAAVIAAIFGAGPWVSSTKGATGHTLGGSSALGVACCLMALQQQIIPGNVGMVDPAFTAIQLVRQTIPAAIDYALCNGFGFGGQNGAIVLGR